jgi:hypothetical protein
VSCQSPQAQSLLETLDPSSGLSRVSAQTNCEGDRAMSCRRGRESRCPIKLPSKIPHLTEIYGQTCEWRSECHGQSATCDTTARGRLSKRTQISLRCNGEGVSVRLRPGVHGQWPLLKDRPTPAAAVQWRALLYSRQRDQVPAILCRLWAL